jgi:hypothetical protein
MRRGQYLSPLTAPAHKSDDVVPVWGIIVFGGATAVGVKPR